MSEGYGLGDLMDYDGGMPLDHMVALKVEAQKAAIERRREHVDGMVVALGSLFDKKILRQWDSILKNATALLGPVAEESRAERTARSMRELQKLRRFMGPLGGMADVPPWEQG